ncbi:MAG: DUF1292 domain-containing protein [Bacilli bacterium]|nr:DUF1292 domain-containing protein [Bacilli bacterium]
MQENQKIKLTNPDGSIVEAEVLLYFNLNETNKDYIIYTFNETDSNDMMTIYTSVVTKNGQDYVLSKIENDEEWSKIKDVMRQVIKDNKE